jgi:DNA-binding beta-propeller fold protein YncE
MLSLVFGDSPAARPRSRQLGAHWRQRAWVLGVLGGSLCACGGDGNGDANVALADSGKLTALTNRNLDIPTTVAVRGDVAWVAESQFDHYAPFGGVGSPGAFRLVGVPLAGDPQAQSIALPANFFPEGVTASPVGRLYVGSIADGSIYTVGPTETTATPFLPANTLDKPSVLGMAVNADGSILWVCNTVTAAPAGTLPSAAIVGIDAATRQIKAKHEMPPSAVGSFCNDIVISANGTLWATESFGGRLFRIPAADLLTNSAATAWLQAAELAGPLPDGPKVGVFGANGLALVSGKLFVVNSSRGTLLSIDPTLAEPVSGDLHPVALTEAGADIVLANPDGVTKVSNTELLVVENGLFTDANGTIVDRGGKRLIRVSLDTQ